MMFKNKILPKILIGILAVALVLGLIYFISSSAKAEEYYTSTPYLKLNNSIKVDKESYYDGTKIFKLPSNVKDTDTISVIVQSERNALYDAYKSAKLDISFQQYLKTEEANKVREEIEAENAEIKALIDKTGVEYKVGATYNTVLSGFEVIIKAGDFLTTAKSFEGRATAIVGEVYNPAKTELVENKVSVYETGIFDSSNFKYDGTGMTVAVLDTGLDYTHTAFKNFNVSEDKLGLTFNDIVDLMNAKSFMAESLQGGLTASDVFVNNKVPFAFDYADGDSDVFPINSDHGTHVAGIIAGKDDTITGVAPNAQLVIMKTFSDVESSARTGWILSALEDCVMLGVDVINMSLGTDCGFSRPTDKENVNNIYDKIKEAGISLVVAASNSYNSTFGSEKNGNLGLTSNPDSATVGSPSTYDSALSIASISGVKTPYLLFGDTIIYFNESSDRVSEEKDFILDVLGKDKTEAEIEFVTIPGVGRMADYTGMDVKGKIVLVRRGDSTFEEKANVAQEQGALGIIVYNNVSGDIKMNVGEATLGAISISQEDGTVLAKAGTGKIKVSTKQVSGPFMSDFSSWGPTPSLGIKPELTAHGGSILSAVPGQDYDRISGTSMATPNMSGVVILLRQYVKASFPEIADDDVKVASLVNCLLMSTADIVKNKNSLPYSVRKQGAGLANLVSASTTKAYVITYDKEGNPMDKTKLELGDDPEKTGVYTLKFDIKNFGDVALSYDLEMLVMTEGVSETKTSHGETTVTEAGYMLSPSLLLNGVAIENGATITVPAGQTTAVEVTVKLSDADKKYLNDSFANGMYVEGFVRLNNRDTAKDAVDLGTPFLAFYGDWSEAPIFDLDYYATNKDELDDGIDIEDKTLPDAYATRPIGAVEGDYVNFMGSFYFEQNPQETPIAADRKYISISNQVGTVHSLEYVWAGLLRNCERIEVTITEDSTGEVVFETVDYDIRKSYSNGQTIFPANVDIGFDAMDYNLKNNTKYTVTLKSFLDYENDGSETNDNNTFTFPLVTDFEAPAVTGVEFYTEYDKSAKQNRLFARVAIYDNHYVMGMQVGYVGVDDTNSLLLTPFDQYIGAVYSEFNTTNYVTYELTDYIQQIKKSAYNKNTFTVAVYDYALNMATYEVGLPDDIADFYFDLGQDEDGNPITTLELSPNQTYELSPKVYPSTEWGELLEYRSLNENVARIVNNKVLAIAPGTAAIVASAKMPDGTTKTAYFDLKVLSEYVSVGSIGYAYNEETGEYEVLADGEFRKDADGKFVKAKDCVYNYNNETKKYEKVKSGEVGKFYKNSGFKKVSKPVVDEFHLTGYLVEKAFYFLSSADRDIGVEGDEMKFVGSHYSLDMFPSEAVTVRYLLDAYFPNETTVEFKSSNDKIVTVDANGKITAKAEGFASITVKVLQGGESTYFSQTITIEVKEPWVTSGPMLASYFGNGGHVTFPENLAVTEIGQFAFANYKYVPKQAWEIDPDSNETYKLWFIGDKTIKSVVIPEGIEKIGAFAFANLTELEEIVLPSTLKMIDQGAFYGCTKLKTVKGIENVKFINQNAFYACNLQGELKLNEAAAVGNYAFASGSITDYYENKTTGEAGWITKSGGTGNEFTSVILSEKTQSIGSYAFYGSPKLESVTIKADTVQLSMCAFADCKMLKEISVNAPVIPAGTFDGCTSLAKVTLGKDVKEIGEYAFSGTAVNSFTVAEGNEVFFPAENKPYLVNKTGDKLMLFATGYAGDVTIDPAIKTIAKNAFSGATRIKSVTATGVTALESYAFAGCVRLDKVTLGELTEIGNYVFHRCNITELPSLNKVSKIGEYAFAETDVTTVNIPNNVEIGKGAFQDCNSLISVVIGNNVNIGPSAFSYNNMAPGNWSVGSFEENGKTYYHFIYTSPLLTLSIGENAVIGANAFYGASNVKTITLGAGAVIGDYAFYNTDRLDTIDLSRVKSIGKFAFSGDVLYQYTNESCVTGYERLDSEGRYVYSYYAPEFKEITLTDIEKLDSEAFAYCRALEKVTLGSKVTSIPSRCFASCAGLEIINLEGITSIEKEAFAESGITFADLSATTNIGEYAFVYCGGLEEVKLNPNGSVIGEGAFSYCEKLNKVSNLNKVTYVGDYAFAYVDITDIDLSEATYIGACAFMKAEATKIKLTLGDKLVAIGGENTLSNQNPFAMCIIDKLTKTYKEEFNGVEYELTTSTFDISDTIKVIDGSIYRVVPNGYVLITYAGNGGAVEVADGTVKLSSLAFAGSDVSKVILPKTVASIGHKAFFDCEKLQVVVFTSYNAPILEEEYDYAYYSTMKNLPAKGDYDFTDFDGSPIVFPGLEIVPYFMYNVATSPTNIYYGANFVDYVGHVENKLVMVRPSNGKNYDSFIFGQYFATVVDGDIAPDDTTLDAISAIVALPELNTITLKDKALVEAARALYNLVATNEQRSLVERGGYLAMLSSAEKRISDLEYLENDKEQDSEPEPTPPPAPPATEEPKEMDPLSAIIILVLLVLAVAGIVVPGYIYVIKPKLKKKTEQNSENESTNESAPANTEAEEVSEPQYASVVSPKEAPIVEKASEETSSDETDAPQTQE